MLIKSLGSSTTQITERSRLGSAHTGQGLDSHTLPQISQKRILGLNLFDGLGQIARFIFGRGQHVEGDTLRALRPDAGSRPKASISRCIAPS